MRAGYEAIAQWIYAVAYSEEQEKVKVGPVVPPDPEDGYASVGVIAEYSEASSWNEDTVSCTVSISVAVKKGVRSDRTDPNSRWESSYEIAESAADRIRTLQGYRDNKDRDGNYVNDIWSATHFSLVNRPDIKNLIDESSGVIDDYVPPQFRWFIVNVQDYSEEISSTGGDGTAIDMSFTVDFEKP